MAWRSRVDTRNRCPIRNLSSALRARVEDWLLPKAYTGLRRTQFPTSGRLVALSSEERIMEFIWFILIGLVAGWLAGQLMKGGGFGVIGDIIVGILGALIGGFLFRSFGVSSGGGLLGSIIVATIGAIVLIFLLRLIKRA
jgi:uncharacterized membrane protein YeaQ/YmgE (transglycosylase-associated protein family)